MIHSALLPTLALTLWSTCSHPVDAWQEPSMAKAESEDGRLRLELIHTGLDSPTFLCSDPEDASRLFILEKTGRLRILEHGKLLDHDLIDLRAQVSTQSERGLLGMAFHPSFPSRPWVFLHYSDLEGDTRISRFTVDPDSWIADPASEVLILHLDQPWSNHNGGMIAFGPQDGYLYIGLGDGGAGDDPRDVGQDRSKLLGKMLRIDIDQGDPYAIPEDNPFVGDDRFRDEIWAYGLRNPWRFCFDPLNGDLYIGDVGQRKWEEIDWQGGSSKGGENYGWRVMEGSHDFKQSAHPQQQDLVAPIHEYGRKGGHCSVTGGYVYRGEAIPWLQGHYFYGDYCSGSVGTLRMQDGILVERVNRTEELSDSGGLGSLVSFGVDADQEMYIVCTDGRIFRIVSKG